MRKLLAITLITLLFTQWNCFAEEYELKLLTNSPSFSQIVGINSSLQAIGTKEVIAGPITSMQQFFFDGKQETEIPKLADFTNVEAEALSDTGLVVGFCSRGIGHPQGSMRAFVWQAGNKNVIALPLPEGDSTSHAQDISADGTTITGYSVGSNPPRMRPCVWTNSDGTWKANTLSVIIDENPFVQAGQVLVRPDGKIVVACITEKKINEFTYDSSLFFWELKDGLWERRRVSEEQFKLQDINESSTIVGSIAQEKGPRAVRITSEGEITKIDLLTGDESNVACGINKLGDIVGFSDDPHGGEGGPQAFIFRNDKLMEMPLPDDTVDSAALCINNDGVIGGFIYRETEPETVTSGFIATKK